MHANNEISTLLPLEKVSTLCRKYNALFHSDTVQTIGHYSFDLQNLDIDYFSCAAHKFHGPKGVGFLYINKKISAKAFELANNGIEEHQQHVQGLKSHMIEQLKEMISGVNFHGEIEPSKSLYTVLNVSFPATDKTGMLLFTMDLKGVACSGGSACSSGAVTGSHVLAGIEADISRPNIRFSFSRYTTKEEIDFALEMVKEVFTVKEHIPISKI